MGHGSHGVWTAAEIHAEKSEVLTLMDMVMMA